MATYWAVPEGFLGDTVNALSSLALSATTNVTWHVVEDSSKPNADAMGPYSLQAAQAEVATLNKTTTPLAITANSTDTGNKLASWETNLSRDLSDLTKESFWLRVAKVVGGAILVLMGVNKLTNGGVRKVGEVAGLAAAA